MIQQSLFIDKEQRLIPPRSIWKMRRKGIYLGTSGYSYDDWIGPFYQFGTKRNQMLDYYQHFFPTVEINYTYYSMPRPSTLFQIRNKAPHTMFTVKAHQSITHTRRSIREEWREFADAMRVLSDTDQLAAALFQFPYSFKCTRDNFDYLDEICEYFNEVKIALEFRHTSWRHETIREYARRRMVTVCSVDAPHLPGLTSNVIYPSQHLAYYRLHGRNSVNWFNGDNVTRYDYTYTDNEITEIVKNIITLALQSDNVYVFANNHPRAQAIETVVKIAQSLEQAHALAAL